MSAYQFFNIKALPMSASRTDLIGKLGYRALFERLQTRIRTAHRTKALLSVSYPLRNDFFISILHIKPDVPYAHGKFLKFDKPGALVDTLTGDHLDSVPTNASAHRHELRFVFDYSRHVIAVQHLAGKSPSTSVLIDTIKFLLEPVLRELYQNHYLEVEVLTSDAELNKVLKTAVKFKRAKVDLSITNSDDYLDDEVKETEDEMEKLGISEISHTESASKDGFMIKLSQKCIAYLKIAKKNGNATIRYMEKTSGKLRSFVMRENPIRIRVPLTRKTHEGEYLDGIHTAIIQADDQAKL
jgi:Domain of unknown function (DUF4747)